MIRSIKLMTFIFSLLALSNLSLAAQLEYKASATIDSFYKLEHFFNLQEKTALLRTIYFFDTPELDLYRQGGIIRFRLSADDDSYDATVKIRPMTQIQLIDSSLSSKKGFKCELDTTENSEVSSCSLTNEEKKLDDDFLASNFLTKSQKKFISEQLSTDIAFKKIKAFGPIFSTTYKNLPYQGHFITIEQWNVLDYQFLELSIKGDESQRVALQGTMQNLFNNLQLEKDKEGSQKTTRALHILKNQQ